MKTKEQIEEQLRFIKKMSRMPYQQKVQMVEDTDIRAIVLVIHEIEIKLLEWVLK